MRILLQRLLFAWWMIPVITVIGIPQAYLMCGWDEAWETYKTIVDHIWNGYK